MARTHRESALRKYEDEAREAWESGDGPKKILESLRTKYPDDEALARIGPTAVTNYANRNGWGERPRPALMPWKGIKREHLGNYHARMLRLLMRRQAGKPLSDEDARRLGSWLRDLEKVNGVVHYDPDYEYGFAVVPRRDEIDLSYVREPDK